MKHYKSEKTYEIVRRLEQLQQYDETLKQVASVILEKLTFYDDCLKSWDRPTDKFSAEEIKTGQLCCNAGINMADIIVNGLRIIFLEGNAK